MGEYMDKKAILRERLDKTVHLTGYDAIYGHARFVAALRQTAGGLLPRWVGYELLEELRVAIHRAQPGVDGVVQIRWAPNEQGCLIPFGPVLAEYDRLEVDLGIIRMIPFAVEEGRLILDLSQGELDESTPRKQRQAAWARARARWAKMTEEEREAALAKVNKKVLREMAKRLKKA